MVFSDKNSIGGKKTGRKRKSLFTFLPFFVSGFGSHMSVMSMQFPQITAQSGSSPDAVSHSSARLWSDVGLLGKRVVFLLLLSLNCFPRFDFRTTDGWRPVTAADRVWVECEWERVAHVDFLTQQPLISSFLLFVPELWGPWVEELNVRLGYGEPRKGKKTTGCHEFSFPWLWLSRIWRRSLLISRAPCGNWECVG